MKITKITEDEAYEMYDEMLRETAEGNFTIASVTLDPADVLNSVDPIAYLVGFSDYLDSISDEYEVEGY